MYQSWNRITFVHWSYEPAEVQRLLPSSLVVEQFDATAWVGLTPFMLEDLSAPGVPPLPWISSSPETNVRTYVRGPDGRSGIWFFSLDIARLPAVVAGRTAYRLPYMWSRLDATESSGQMRYWGRRRWGGPDASYDIEIQPARPLREDEVGAFDDFLTGRWTLFTFYGRVPASVAAEHPPWPLWKARPIRIEQNLLAAAGLPAPSGDPVLHFSPGVRARIGVPRMTTTTT
jgi:uncharacterized protein